MFGMPAVILPASRKNLGTGVAKPIFLLYNDCRYPPVAKLDIAVDSDSKGRGFESLRAGQAAASCIIACGGFFIKTVGALNGQPALLRCPKPAGAAVAAAGFDRCVNKVLDVSRTAGARTCCPFSEKGHAAPSLLACKRARGVSACYQPFSGTRGFETCLLER